MMIIIFWEMIIIIVTAVETSNLTNVYMISMGKPEGKTTRKT
jgi:hypothetical protein